MRMQFYTTIVQFEPKGFNFTSAVSWTRFQLEHFQPLRSVTVYVV